MSHERLRCALCKDACHPASSHLPAKGLRVRDKGGVEAADAVAGAAEDVDAGDEGHLDRVAPQI